MKRWQPFHGYPSGLARCCCAALIACLLSASSSHAQNDTGGNDSGRHETRPVVTWHFDGAEEPGVPKIDASFEPGPRPPRYPSFKPENKAWRIRDARSIITVREKDLAAGKLRFAANDAITLEAWVKVEELKDGSFAYLLGKGRHGKPGFPENNQNYALRLKGEKGEARVSFLFCSKPEDGKPADFHRWTTTRGFPVGAAWHHVAITYTFGKSASIRGYIDGKAAPGTWDMGGATDRAPVADADDLVLGTGNGGAAGNSFRGWMDDVAIWRIAVPEDVLMHRYQFVPPAPVVKRDDLPKGQVLVQLCEEGMLTRNAWPDTPPPAADTYAEDAFGFFAVPHRYVDTGVRGDRPNPFLFRAAAVVTLPAGKHRLLLRARGASRLYADTQLLLTTPFPPEDGSGHGHVRKPESYLNLGPDFRFAPPGNRETTIAFDAKSGEHLFVLETIVGGFTGKQKRRPELGETVVAIALEGRDDWHLLTPGTRAVPYTDAGWSAYEAERSAHYDRVNTKARQAARERNKPYWDRRRAAARTWLSETKDVAVPELPRGYPAHNPIDHFLADRLARVEAENSAARKGTIDYFKQVQPLLEARCYDCHAGSKVKGKLRLDDRAAALKGGKSDGPAIAPGAPDKSALLRRVRSADTTEVMPPKGEPLTKEQARILETWIREGAAWPEVNAARTALTPLTDDLAFLRRVTLDTVGVVPTLEEVRVFQSDPAAVRRTRAIDHLLADPRTADHAMGYWQDVLAENPNILNPTLNNTGPFRWWLHESLLDNKPMDLFVTELVRMRGSERFGGPAGFGVASQNDAPMAAKATIVASAFLGMQMKCARCHDAPSHQSTQRDLFELAALLGTKAIKLPTTSSVPLDRIHQGGRTPLIQVTLKPGTVIEPRWPFASLVEESVGKTLAEQPDNPRDRLAAVITAPHNERFAQVIANRIWQRYMGRGIVEPVDDWEKGKPTHPDLLRWLARELVRNGYDVKHLSRLILTSHAYQRSTDRALRFANGLYAAPAPRRLAAEQIVDSLFTATGKPFRLEEVSLDVDGMRDLGNSITLGKARRAWMLTSTSNERDRPSLSLPRLQAVADVLQAFGWRGARQEPTTTRDLAPNVLQPAILANGTMGIWVTRLSDDHGLTPLALKDQPLETFLDELFLKILTRPPTDDERANYVTYLKPGYDRRIRPASGTPARLPRKPEPYVSWSNHLDPQATVLRQKQEAAARNGDPPTDRLDPNWRGRLEDVLWALLNSSEFVFAP
jgi:hypothetical protein